MREVYKQLGIFEPQDQTEFANYMADNNKWIDKDNIAIWGWVSLNIILKVFMCN